jgi:ArsR family transcriptional regulator, arsenate/arsenite/antimonite-responsive transcriptional repressor
MPYIHRHIISIQKKEIDPLGRKGKVDFMAGNKKDEFQDSLRDLAKFAKAFSHPARIAILQTIAEKEECICGEIVEVLPLAQSTVSQHLKELKDLDLIHGEIDGAKSCYCINWETMGSFSNAFQAFLEELHHHKKGTKSSCQPKKKDQK